MSKSAAAPARVARTEDAEESVTLGFVADDTVTVKPVYKTGGAVGFDIAASENVRIPRWQHRLVKTGLRFEIPEGYEIQVRTRSGFSAKQGGFILNSPGTVDWDYKGELVLIVCNLGMAPLQVSRGDRIAQGVLAPVTRLPLKQITLEDMTKSDRGEGRFGSTGT